MHNLCYPESQFKVRYQCPSVRTTVTPLTEASYQEELLQKSQYINQRCRTALVELVDGTPTPRPPSNPLCSTNTSNEGVKILL
jgi:hypothetical protein